MITQEHTNLTERANVIEMPGANDHGRKIASWRDAFCDKVAAIKETVRALNWGAATAMDDAADAGRQLTSMRRDVEDFFKAIKQQIDATKAPVLAAEKEALAQVVAITDALAKDLRIAREAEQKRRQDEADKKAREQQAAAKRRFDAATAKVDALIASAHNLDEQRSALEASLNTVESEEEAAIVREKLRLLASKIDATQQQAQTIVAKAEAAQPLAAPVVAAPVVTKGVIDKEVIASVACINVETALLAVTNGIIPASCIKWDESALKKLAAAGVDLSRHGFVVTKSQRMGFR